MGFIPLFRVSFSQRAPPLYGNHMLKQIALTLLACTPTLAAQTPAQPVDITLATPVTSARLVQWLHSGDPRLIAWSATLAVRNHDVGPILQMPALLQTWNPVLGDTHAASRPAAEQGRAIEAILDALIVEQTPVTLPAIKAIAENFPVQAAILINRLPLSESQSILHDWTYGATGTWNARLLARIGALMIAQKSDPHPDPTFVAEIVAAAEENLQIEITSGSGGELSGMGPACGDSFGRPLAPGWPQVFVYDLEESNSSPLIGDTTLLELDADRIGYRRYAENQGHGSCSGVEYLNPVTRHRLIAHWLGVAPRAMPWQPTETAEIVWTDLAAYQQQLGAIVEAHRAKLKATYDTLLERKLLQPSPYYPVSSDQGVPRLTITIQCQIKPCPIDLPK